MIELGSNTMASGSHGLSLVGAVQSLNHSIWLDHNDVLKDADNILQFNNGEDFISSAINLISDYDVVVLMTNKDSQKILKPIINSLEKK